MSEIDLDALERLNVERTRERWVARGETVWCDSKELPHRMVIWGNPVHGKEAIADAAFIAALANNADALITLARRAQDTERKLEELRKEVVYAEGQLSLHGLVVVTGRLRAALARLAP